MFEPHPFPVNHQPKNGKQITIHGQHRYRDSAIVALMKNKFMPGATGESELSLATGAEVRPAAARHDCNPNKRLIIMKRTKIYLTILALAAGSLALMADDAAATWEKTCQKCHGPDGKGQTKMGGKMGVKDFTDAKYQSTFTDDQGCKAIKEGVKDGDKTKMKPVEGVTDDDAKALVAKVRAFKQ